MQLTVKNEKGRSCILCDMKHSHVCIDSNGRLRILHNLEFIKKRVKKTRKLNFVFKKNDEFN